MNDENNTLNDFTKYDIFEKWKKLQNFPTLGIFGALTRDYNEYVQDIVELNQILMDLQKYMSNYWLQMSRTQFQAIGNVLLKSRSDSKMNNPDSERFRALVIDAFEDTVVFESVND